MGVCSTSSALLSSSLSCCSVTSRLLNNNAHQLPIQILSAQQEGASESHLEVLVQEVEEQQNRDEEGQGKGRCHGNQDDGGSQLQATPSGWGLLGKE